MKTITTLSVLALGILLSFSTTFAVETGVDADASVSVTGASADGTTTIKVNATKVMDAAEDMAEAGMEAAAEAKADVEARMDAETEADASMDVDADAEMDDDSEEVEANIFVRIWATIKGWFSSDEE